MKKFLIGDKNQLEKYDFRETCFGINIKRNKILLVFDKTQYSLVGGGVDSNESHEESLRREFKEEIGYDIKNIVPLFTIDCFWLAGGKWPMESLSNFYYVELSKRNNKNSESKAEYISVEKALELLELPYQKKAIEIFLKEKTNFS